MIPPESGCPERVGLAVSGGPDSLALLVLAEAAMPGAFAVATVDHGLRAQSAAEAAMVGDICAARGVPHAVIMLDLAGGAGVQARARAARYAALGQWAAAEGLGAIVTAHHADDQAETMVMRLNRGAGVRGLGAMRARATVPGHPGLPLLRPLLGWRRAALAEVVAKAGIVAADDPSNRDARFERARLRAAMTSAEWLDINGLAASATHLAEADEALDWAAEQAFAQVETRGDALAWHGAVPRVVALRVLERIVARLGSGSAGGAGGDDPRGAALARWLEALEGGAVATLAGVRGDGRRRPWRFASAAPHRRR